MQYDFEWAPGKAQLNRRKHGVGFEQAATVFRDPRANPDLLEPKGDQAGDAAVLGVERGKKNTISPKASAASFSGRTRN